MPPERDRLRDRLDRATAHLDPPFAVVDLTAFDHNTAALAGRAAGKPLRVASKSVRCRSLLTRALARPGWHGVMAYTLAEAIWLVRTGVTRDVLVAYPTADKAALRELATDTELATAVTIMVDSTAQLDLVDSVVPPNLRAPLRVCLELDASWRPLRGGPGGRLHIGVRRSPVHSPTDAGALAAQVTGRRGFRLVGLMAYEAQIAGLADAPPRQALRGALIRAIQRRSYQELLHRRGSAVAAVREHADLEFVNGGGTGSIAATCADTAVTEVTAGSGLYGPTLFDGYRAWRPTPAAFFALSVVRRPTPRIATVVGGGWIASGPAERSRLPSPWLPAGLTLIGTEGAGEVQTPLAGAAADRLRVGDRVWFRHAKAGELCEHVNEVHLIDDDRIVASVPTYRGEGHAFL
ncbi:MAG TPA: amino acid deaminase/aldolase [Micromonosporaceae bacterium]|nr:amino acid deaminase/aldolase [Micromonosporaceae bacterium]